MGLALISLLCAGVARAQPGISYGPDPLQRLDLSVPPGPGPFQLVVFVHGGGWTAGDKASGAWIAPPLLKAGYAVASVNYRLAPAVPVALQADDIAAAIAVLLGHAPQYRLLPGSVALLGHSAGGHLAALLGTDAAYLRRAGLDPALLRLVVTLDGVFDITAHARTAPGDAKPTLFGADPAGWKALSPVRQVPGMALHPAFCLAYEDTDPRFIEQATRFRVALHKHHETFGTALAQGLTHLTIATEFASPAQIMRGFTLDCLKRFDPGH